MRRTIRLTGRRQLPVSSFDLKIEETAGKQLASLSCIDTNCLTGFPVDAEVRLRLSENKFVEVLRFGTIGQFQRSAEIGNSSFRAPSCQVRVVSSDPSTEGMQLGSTKNWTYKSDGETDGILLFQPGDTQPRAWKLDIRDDENPILYVDDRIEDAAAWAKSDPVFIACVFPHIISEIFRHILNTGSKPEDGWMEQWIGWAASLMPNETPPFDDDQESHRRWIESLTITFAGRHKLADQLVLGLATAGEGRRGK